MTISHRDGVEPSNYPCRNYASQLAFSTKSQHDGLEMDYVYYIYWRWFYLQFYEIENVHLILAFISGKNPVIPEDPILPGLVET